MSFLLNMRVYRWRGGRVEVIRIFLYKNIWIFTVNGDNIRS